MRKYLLEITVFFTGMSVMVFELVGSRVLAPFVGTSIIVWTSLIGVILAALSLGYWWGGRVSDRNPTFRQFAFLIFMAGLLIGLTAILKFPILNFFGKIKDVRWDSLLASIVLFGPGSFFLAAVSPYAVRLKIANVKDSGETVGNLSAIATVGSIFGAFFTGFILISYLGNTKILFLLAGILVLISIWIFSQKRLVAKIGLLVLLLGGFWAANRIDQHFLPAGVAYINSQYSDIIVGHAKDIYSNIDTGNGTGRPIITLSTDLAATQSAMFADNDNDLVLAYAKFFRELSTYFQPKITNALIIGGAAYSYPKDFLRNNPNSNIDVVEIDPKMTQVAQQYFNLKSDSRLTTYNEDGRIFLNQNQKKYDAIFMDAFKSNLIPFQLTTKEAVSDMYNSLNDGGVVAVNIISSINGDQGKFFRAEYATYKSIFPQVYVFRVEVPFDTVAQNLILVATKSNQSYNLSPTDKTASDYFQHFWNQPIPTDMPILTDDFAPVDQEMLGVSKEN